MTSSFILWRHFTDLHIDFGKKQLRKVLVKTANYRSTMHTIPLTSDAIEILKRWKKKCGNKRFVFGLLDDDTDLDIIGSLSINAETPLPSVSISRL